ncbi:portal protein [Bradyrhizobium japonicum]|uniref:portal protein n=1 Tax=Bradyrhizobium japonicum TaxID=375 RepID=UPI00042902D0|nr:hypothetical protein [Bradyrhizobium japonicum]
MTTVIETPPGEDGFEKPDNLFARAEKAALSPAGGAPAAQEEQNKDIDWLNLVSQAETQGGQFMLNQIKDAWDRSYKAFHNQHFSGSKYLSASYKGRSKLFRPKTRGAVRKANAAAAAALFSTVNTINCSAGNENDPVQKANADLMQQLINYRTDRTSGKAAIPWFRIAIGAHQDTLIMSACLSKSHRIFPMSHVEAWQPLQQEINDLANLRLDQVKQNVSPITFVKRGRQVDLSALQRRGPNSVILRTDADDIEFAQTPEVPSSAYAEMERLNVDFDDQAGQFNSGTVQTNRSLNETVGGMNLISASANSVQEFDLRTWVETWVEPVMGQLVRLEQYYESDKTILGLCADKAQLFQKHGITEITDELLMEQVTLRIDAGMGASNPQTKLGNFATALKVIAPVWQNHPDVVAGRKVPNLEELTNEAFSLSGYRDGGKRFIKDGAPQQPNPAVAAQADKLKSEAEKNRSTAVVNQAKAQEIDTRLKMDFAELVHGQQMDRAQLVHQVRSERENMQRDRVNDDRQQHNTEADREMRQRETELKNKPAEKPSGDLISELTALLQRYGANNGSMAAR